MEKRRHIIVTGLPGFGTSKVMQLFADRGYRVFGEKWPSNFPQDLHPGGVYDGHHVLDGLAEWPSECEVIKLMYPGLMKSPIPHDALIVNCVRNHIEAMSSQLRRGMGWCWNEDDAVDKNIEWHSRFELWRRENSHGMITVKHEDWLLNPEVEKARVMEFVDGIR